MKLCRPNLLQLLSASSQRISPGDAFRPMFPVGTEAFSGRCVQPRQVRLLLSAAFRIMNVVDFRVYPGTSDASKAGKANG